MKIRLIRKRKLRVAAARRMPRTGAEDYAQDTNMSFGRAIVVVVVLHLVAVAGICTFFKAQNYAQQSSSSRLPKDTAADAAATGDAGDTSSKAPGQPAAQEIQAPANAPARSVVAGVKQAAGANPGEQSAKPPVNETASSVKDAGAFYTVVKGDTPKSIARKLHVSYDDLLKLNRITDPKKLRIGEKLRIPAKKKPTLQTRGIRALRNHVS